MRNGGEPVRSRGGLVARFTFDDASNFGYDSVQKKTIGTVYSTSIMNVEAADPTACEAPHVRGLQVAGGWWQNNYMVVPGEAFGSAQGIPCGNQAVTYSLWVNPATGWQADSSLGLGTFCNLLRHCKNGREWYDQNNSASLFIKKTGDSVPQLVFGVGLADAAATSAAYTLPTAFDGNWHFIAATCAERVLTLYYDGAKVAETTLTADVALDDNAPLTIGDSSPNFNDYCAKRYMGRLDDIRVYSRALTADEVKAVYAAGATAFDTDVICWTGAADGGTVENAANWDSVSNRRTAGEIYAAGAVLDVTALNDGGVLTHGTDDATLTVKGIVCTNGQREVTLDVKAGNLSLHRPSAQRGLVAHFSFDDPNDMGRDSGAYDRIGTTNIAFHSSYEPSRVPYGIASIPGVVGRALDFENNNWWVNPYFLVPGECCHSTNAFPCGAETITYSIWLKPAAMSAGAGTGSGPAWVIRRGSWGDGLQTVLWLMPDKSQIVWSIANWEFGGPNSVVCEVPALFDGQWHHVVASYADRTLRLFCDGELKATLEQTAATLNVADGSSLMLGNNGTDLNSHQQLRYAGGMDELKVFNVALTDEEVAAEYARRSLTLDRTPLGTVPSPVTVRLAAGTKAGVRGYGHEYGSFVGTGDVAVGPATELRLEGVFGLTGLLTGVGSVTVGGFAPGADGSAFTGTFTLAENAVIRADGAANEMRPLLLGGRLALPSAATVDFGADPVGGKRILARAAEVVLPDGGFANWRDPNGAKVNVRVKNGELRCSPKTGVAIIIR